MKKKSFTTKRPAKKHEMIKNNFSPQKNKIPKSVLEWVMGSGIIPKEESNENIKNISLFYKITQIAPPQKEEFDIYKSRLETYIVRVNEDKLRTNYKILTDRYSVSKNVLNEILNECTEKNLNTFRKNKEKIQKLSQQILKEGLKCMPK